MKKDIKVSEFSEIANGIASDKNISSFDCTYGDKTITVKVKNTMTDQEFVEIAEAICIVCCDRETGEYHPEKRHAAETVLLANYMTNITLPKNPSDAYNMLMSSGLYYRYIEPKFEYSQIMELDDAIDKVCGIFVAQHNSEAVKKVDDAITALNGVTTIISKMFEGINSDEINGVLKTMLTDGIDEEKIAKAVLKSREK